MVLWDTSPPSSRPDDSLLVHDLHIHPLTTVDSVRRLFALEFLSEAIMPMALSCELKVHKAIPALITWTSNMEGESSHFGLLFTDCSCVLMIPSSSDMQAER